MKKSLVLAGACSAFISSIAACGDGNEGTSRTALTSTGEVPSNAAGASSSSSGSAGADGSAVAGGTAGASGDNAGANAGADTPEGPPELVDAGSEAPDGSTSPQPSNDDAGTSDEPSGELETPTQGDGEDCNVVDNRILLAEGARCSFTEEQRELFGQIVGTNPPEEGFCTEGSVSVGFAIAGQITINGLQIRCTRVLAAS
jgi:hypothetical protein